MTRLKLLVKGLLGATALTAFTAGTAHAAGTQAGTSVSNTFTVDYKVGTVDQPQIDTSDAGDPNGPTVFIVDRLVDVTVTPLTPVTVAPGASNQGLFYAATNTGNDTQAFSLDIFEETTDDFDTDDSATFNDVRYFYSILNGVAQTFSGTTIDYDPADPPVINPDDRITIVVTQNIPTTVTDGQTSEITLVADALDPVTFDPVEADSNGNELLGDAENVLADGSSTARENDNSGDDSAVNSYIVGAATLAADKVVDVHSEDGTTCATFPGTVTGGYAVPGACVEYIITVTNTGSADALDIVVGDDLAVSGNLSFSAVTFDGFTGGSFTGLPASGANCGTDGAAVPAEVPCTVTFTGGSLPAPILPATETVGTVTIRATVK